MAKIVRYNGNLVPFASSSLGTERTIFGQVTQANDITSQFTPQFLRGWGIVGPSDQPTLQDFNAVSYTHGQILSYLHQVGIAEYDALQEYFIGSITNVSGIIYASKVNSNVGNSPASSPAQWAAITGTGRIARTLRFSRVGGVQQVSIDGGANTTVGASIYTPLANISFVMVEAVGGGGAGGGAVNPTAGNVALGAPGASGSYGESIYTAAQIGSSQSVTIGLGGTSPSGAAGTAGGATSLGALLTCPGGGGGFSSPAGGVGPGQLLGQYGATSAPTGANLVAATGASGGPSVALNATVAGSYGGQGGGNPFGTPTSFAAANTSGIAATSYGAGGSGVILLAGAGPSAGAAGAAGVLIIREYI